VGHLHVVVALQVHRDLGGPEVVVLPQVEDLADHVDMGGVGEHEIGHFGSDSTVAFLPVRV